MPPSMLLDKLKKGRRKHRLSTVDTDSTSTDPAPRTSTTPRNVLRSLSVAANRTFHFPSLSGSSPSLSPTTVQNAASPASTAIAPPTDERYFTLAEPPGPEASFAFTSGGNAPPVSVGAATAAGWHLVPDQGGSGQPLRARKPNQDSFDVRGPTLANGLYVAVFDGHGGNGREASQLVRNVVPKLVKESLQAAAERGVRPGGVEKRRCFWRAFAGAFTEGERCLRDEMHGIDHAFSGTTATCCWLDGNELYCAWVGDSRCVLARRVGGGQGAVVKDEVVVGEDGGGGDDGGNSGNEEIFQAVDLSSDQKPARKDEKRRVRAAGGRVTRWQAGTGPQRVWLPEEWLPGLAMTRSVGDTILTKYGVIATPEVTVTQVGREEEILILASDGVWEFMSSEEVVRFVGAEKEAGCDAMEVARKLVEEAVRRWQEREMVVDDTTAVVVFLNCGTERRESLFGEEAEDGTVRVRSIGARFRRMKSDGKGEVRVGEPWLVGSNGKMGGVLGRSLSEDETGGESHDDDGVA